MATDIDPRLEAIAGRDVPEGIGLLRALFRRSEPRGISIHVKVADLPKFQRREGVYVRSVIGPDENGEWLATATVLSSHLSAILAAPEVISAEASSLLRPQLSSAIQNMAARPEDFPGARGNRGEGVVIGIVDSGGIDYRLWSFREGNSSRFRHVWALEGDRKFTKAQIDQALATGRVLVPYPLGTITVNTNDLSSHAAAVANCAAGGDPANPGVASKSELIYVELANVFPWQAVPQAFCDSSEVLDAVDFIFAKAGTDPCVINISQGTLDGPGNSLPLACQHMEKLLAAQPNRAVVISAGNYGDDLYHAALTVGPAETRPAAFRIWPREDATERRGWIELNAWYSPGGLLSFRLIGPANTYGPFPLGPGVFRISENGKTVFEWAHLERPALKQRQLHLAFADAARAGVWTLEVTGTGAVASAAQEVDIYLVGGGNASSPWFEDSVAHRGRTLVSLACSPNLIVVGAHDGVTGGANRPVLFSSVGPTRDGLQKPDFTAPGVSLKLVQPGGKFSRAQGTSFAAPLVAGVAALCLAEAKARGGQLTAGELRQLLIDTARQDAGPRVWDASRGWGRVDAEAALREVARRFP
jgi:subtilisin family serine protease